MARLFANILYFIAGTTPTQADIEAADALGPGAKFRNAQLIQEDAPLEQCDGVAGDAIPHSYAEAFPNADSNAEGVRDNMMKRNPALADMKGDPTLRRESEREKAARIENARARGQQRAPVNERNADPVPMSMRTTQAGGPRVDPAAVAPPNDGWGTEPITHDDTGNGGNGNPGSTTNLPPGGPDAGSQPRGEGGAPEGEAAQVGAQGAGGPGQRTTPQPATAGAGNPRTGPASGQPATSGAKMPRPGNK